MAEGSLPGQAVFTSRKRGACLSCLDRDAINLLGRPRFRSGAPATYFCEECGDEDGKNGKGSISLPDHLRADPYLKGVSERVAYIEGRKSRPRSTWPQGWTEK